MSAAQHGVVAAGCCWLGWMRPLNGHQRLPARRRSVCCRQQCHRRWPISKRRFCRQRLSTASSRSRQNVGQLSSCCRTPLLSCSSAWRQLRRNWFVATAADTLSMLDWLRPLRAYSTVSRSLRILTPLFFDCAQQGPAMLSGAASNCAADSTTDYTEQRLAKLEKIVAGIGTKAESSRQGAPAPVCNGAVSSMCCVLSVTHSN